METIGKASSWLTLVVCIGTLIACGYKFHREFITCEVNPLTGRNKEEDKVWVAEQMKERLEREAREKKALDAITFELVTAIYNGQAGRSRAKLGEILFQTQFFPDGERVFNCPESARIFADRVVIHAVKVKSKWDGYTGDKALWDKLCDDWEAGKPI